MAPQRSTIPRGIVTALVFLALAEGLLGLLGYPPWRGQPVSPDEAAFVSPDPELGWINPAGVHTPAAPEGAPFLSTNWSQGRRATAEQEPASDDARPRLIFVGDAYVYGYGLGDADTFAWRIQQTHPEFQVSNYGTPGYGAFQSYVRLDRELDRRGSGTNGGGVSAYYLLNGFHESRNVGDPSWIRVREHPENGVFFPYAVLENGALEDRRSTGVRIWPVSQWSRLVAVGEEYYQKAEAWTRVRKRRDVTEAILVRMEHAAQLAGGKFTVILFDLDPKDRPVYRNFLSARGIPFIDCDGPELTDRSLRLAGGYPNARLNALLAQWIEAPWLSANATTAQNR